MAERHLLGVLHNDHKYLKNLLKNPILNINLKHMTEEEQEEASIGTETESKVSQNYPLLKMTKRALRYKTPKVEKAS